MTLYVLLSKGCLDDAKMTLYVLLSKGCLDVSCLQGSPRRC